MVVQKRLGVVSPRGFVVALAVIGALALGTLALIWISASSASTPLTQAPAKSFPYGPADRNGADENAIIRGANADSDRYAAQVRAEVTQTQTRGPR